MPEAKRRVFVMGAYWPNGGTYMAYHLAHIVARHLDHECIVVKVADETPGSSVFEYPVEYPSVSIEEMEQMITDSDLLIANPSFSHLRFGLRLPGRKLMYVQHFNTFDVIDGFFDHYVCVSEIVRRFVEMVYGMSPPVIPAFIHTERMPPAAPWKERPQNRILAFTKHYGDELVERFRSEMERVPEIEYQLEVLERPTHAEMLERMAAHRYFMPLSPLEGFGLTPLEAMASGCTVVGFHGGGGLDYMEPGRNCEVVAYPNVAGLAEAAQRVLRDPAASEQLAMRGLIDADRFGYSSFEARWLDVLESFGLAREDAGLSGRAGGEGADAQAFDNRSFWNRRYRENSALGSGIGSRHELLEYKVGIITDTLDAYKPRSVLDVGCGDMEIASRVPFDGGYTGIDISDVIIDRNRHAFPHWQFLHGDFADMVEAQPLAADLVMCLDVLIHQHDPATYRRFATSLVAATKKVGLVAAYDHEPRQEFSGPNVVFHEPITETLRAAGATSIERVGVYRDTAVVRYEVARENEPRKRRLQISLPWSAGSS